ncbi:Thioredoxin reductase [Salinivirga cyanobacteriivorans]|uniref:Thioredoxin reductase n=1 Tax=Salinivirga cyanobacteriivorans TaxID=1307839 RepID=A0A0S2HW24_9BACT|nr:cyclic nucleotide-binding domain-containing thioredoxin-disulfide reductase [Salinivirga cyanobacteriivorans]ALO14255.1 Thioredoxin reductase [Salinivirga cyanobacteriivorans]
MNKQNNHIFPKLTKRQIKYLTPCGSIVTFEREDVIIKQGEQNYDLYVVLEGEIYILDPYDNNKFITCHRAGEFTGDSDMLSDRAAMFRAMAKTRVKALRIAHNEVKKIIARNSELNDIFIKAFFLRRVDILERHEGGYTLVGSRFSQSTFRIREFLSKNYIRYTWLDTEKDQASEDILLRLGISQKQTPIVIDPDLNVYRNPSLEEIAKHIGLSAKEVQNRYDVLIVGAGPAGLAASVYGASEGLSIITIDQIGPGGQAGNSSLIENYLGFPTGISGNELANRAYLQAQKFGCTISVPFRAKELIHHGHYFELLLSNGKSIKASTVIAATGAQYRTLNIPGIKDFHGKGLYYGATPMEARTCKDENVVVVGGGNSAGQAALFLANHAAHVHLIIRGEDLTKSMSSYLINRIVDNSKITLHTRKELKKIEGNLTIEKIQLYNHKTKKEEFMDITNVFSFIGATPSNKWIAKLVCTDKDGFVLTGNELSATSIKNWPLNRNPFPLETCIPGLFVVGDLRSGSTKRVASAVGEGSMAISYVHQVLP